MFSWIRAYRPIAIFLLWEAVLNPGEDLITIFQKGNYPNLLSWSVYKVCASDSPGLKAPNSAGLLTLEVKGQQKANQIREVEQE